MNKIENNHVDVIGVPLDLGANIRGANIGPSAIRIAGLKKAIKHLNLDMTDLGDLLVPVRESITDETAKEFYLPVIKDVCELLAAKVENSLTNDHFPLVLGGDHSIALGTISGVSGYCKKNNQELGIIWIDAHADLNTPSSSPSGNIHGMPLSILLGDGDQRLVNIHSKGAKIKPENVAIIGLRNIDGIEKDLVRESGINYYSMRKIDELGMFGVMNDAIEKITKKASAIHISFDIDGIDPLYAPGVSTPVSGGISYREAHLALEMIADTQKLISAEFVELNPVTDQSHRTAILAVELIQSALGKSIV